MDFVHEANRVYVEDEAGAVIAEITFPDMGGGRVEINHTFVSPVLRGGGVAAMLMDHAYDEIKSSGRTAVPTCSYSVSWFEKHEDKRDILAED
ncbi:MAG: N-acetyltransferase [Synergistaceae bacterium]|jgi:predicted GNAT family acetyltransferase|nr:N-acetyltransferase [Synergistaceae bacterium]